MTDGNLESRLGRLEQNTARLEQGMIDVNRRVDTLVDLPKLVAVLTEQVKNLGEDLTTFATKAAQDRETAANREASHRRDKAATRQWAIGILVTILLGLLAASVVLIAQAH